MRHRLQHDVDQKRRRQTRLYRGATKQVSMAYFTGMTMLSRVLIYISIS